MKLLYVIHQYFPNCHSGTEQYCLAASREARRRGDEVVVLSLDDWEQDSDPTIHIWDWPYDGFKVLRIRHKLALQPNEHRRDFDNRFLEPHFSRILDEVRPDAVHFFHLRRLGSNLLRVAADAGIRTVVHLMDFWYLCPRFTLRKRDGTLCQGPPDGGRGCIPCHAPDATEAEVVPLLERPRIQLERLARADHVIAPSRFLANIFEQNGFPTGRLRVVGYGLEPGRVTRREVERPRAPLRIAFAGVMSPWKAPRVLVDAVLGIDDDLRLSMRGRVEGTAFSDYVEPMLAAAAGDERIEFPGEFGHEQLSDILAETDVLVVPSVWYENTPFVVLEAFEAGVPVIASDLGGMSEVVTPGVNGMLFPAGDAGALAELLHRCASDPAQLAALRPEPVASIADNYDAFLECYR